MSRSPSWRPLALLVGAAFFMEQLDTTILATALPQMALEFDTSPVRMNLALTAYLVSLCTFIPLSGRLADRFGSRTVFRGAILIFTLGSLFCALAPNLELLILFRLLQGIGGAAMLPVGRLLLLRAAPRHEMVRAMAWVLIPGMIGPMLGPLLGGLIVTYASWRWIFYVNLPIGVIGLLLASRHAEQHVAPERVRLDLAGTALCGLGLSALVVGLEGAAAGEMPVLVTTATLAVVPVCVWLYLRHAGGHRWPVLELSLLRIPTFGVAILAGTLFRIGFGAMPFLLPALLQVGLGASPAKSGLMTFSAAAAGLAMKALSAKVLTRFGFKDVVVWNGTLCAISLAACALFRPGWPELLIYLVLITGGFARSLQFNVYGTLAYADVPPPKMSAATSFHDTFQQLSMAIGISVGALILSTSIRLHGHAEPTLGDFSTAFLAVGLISLAAVPFCLGLRPDAGAKLVARPQAGKG
ncbi:MFS transporter [Roseococcus sp. YIM B11640]|uniref:MFS transporter n=1 Tax=Roseococcus sp. YIM B11640 TaxID=3133973 RepID=UPI003C7B3E85